MLAQLALSGGLRILDGGNSFQAHAVTRCLRRQTMDVRRTLEDIQIARAFTCYQVLSLLEQTPCGGTPTFGLELLTTFADESMNYRERKRLLEHCIAHLQRLSQAAPVAISASTPAPGAPSDWLRRLEARVDRVWKLEPPTHAHPVRLL
ncbi:MAG: hypothetical protein VB089_14530 [Anaerolineaceae bacterium]|nr:hypothetical protein [Anaerolineaceae bacterium]